MIEVEKWGYFIIPAGTKVSVSNPDYDINKPETQYNMEIYLKEDYLFQNVEDVSLLEYDPNENYLDDDDFYEGVGESE